MNNLFENRFYESDEEVDDLDGIAEVYEIDGVYKTFDGRRLITLPPDKQDILRREHIRQLVSEQSRRDAEADGLTPEEIEKLQDSRQETTNTTKFDPEKLKTNKNRLYKQKSAAKDREEKLRKQYKQTMIHKSRDADSLSDDLVTSMGEFISNQVRDKITYKVIRSYDDLERFDRMYGDPSYNKILQPGEEIVRTVVPADVRPLVLVYLDQSASFTGSENQRKIELEKTMIESFKTNSKYDVKYFRFGSWVEQIDSPDDLTIDTPLGPSTNLDKVILSIKEQSKDKLVNVVIVTDCDACMACTNIRVLGSVWLVYALSYDSGKLLTCFGGRDPKTAETCEIKQFIFENI